MTKKISGATEGSGINLVTITARERSSTKDPTLELIISKRNIIHIKYTR